MKRTYKKKSNLINKTGYTPGYDTEKNPVNYIPSEDITMANTPYPLYATPLDESGNPIGKGMTMQPGGEYKFPGAAYVAETPMFAKGGEKSDWISAKISTLVKEGYPQKQAVAIAYSMYEDIKKENGGFQLPMYQTAGKYSFTNNFPGSNFPKPKFSADPNIATPEQFSEQMNKITEVNPAKYVSPLSEESLTAGKDFKKRTDEINKAAGLPQNFSKNIFGETTTENTEDKSKVAPPDIKGGEPFQFFNPYGGFDIPTAASTLGSSIEGGDTLGTVASGLKLATGLARNFFGGMGQERRRNFLIKQEAEKQKEGMVGTGKEQIMEGKFGGYYQDGGMEQPQGGDVQQQVVQALQQGMSPEEVMQQLVQMGMPEEQAMSLIQGIMQQMQGSTPQLRRGGTMYYQQGGDYDTYNEKDFKDNDIVRHSGGNTGLTKSEVNSLAKHYKMSPQDFLNIVSYGEPGEGMSSKYELSIKGSDKYLPKNWRETYNNYKENKPSTTGFKGVLNKGLDYIGVDPIFNMGGYYQDGGEQQVTQQVAQAMQQGMQPQEAMSMLMESGMTEDQAVKMVQAIMQQLEQQPETPQLRKGGCYQEGGMEPGADPAEAMMQQVSQMLQQGAEPEQIMQMLIEAGVPEDQAMQMVQAVIQQMQGSQQPQATPQMRRGGGYYQQGGEAMDEQMEGEDEGAEGESAMLEQVEAQVEQALKQGADPQQVLQQLVQMGIPQEVAQQMIEEILQEIQGGETGMEAPEEATPQMSKGGKYMRALVGKTIKNYTYNPKTDSYIVSYE